MNNLITIASDVASKIQFIPLLDLVGLVIIILCFVIGFLRKTWMTIWAIIVFATLFAIAWFFVVPKLSQWVLTDSFNFLGIKPKIDFVYTLPATIEDLANAGLNIPLEGYSGTLTLHINFSVEINSLEEFFQILLVDSPFITQENKAIFYGETASQIAGVVANSISWIVLIPVVIVVGIIIYIPTYPLFKFIFFRGRLTLINVRSNSRLLGGVLGLMFGFWLVFTITQSLQVWAPGMAHFHDNYVEVTKLFSDGSYANINVFGDALETLATDFNPSTSNLFGWMGGAAKSFGDITLGDTGTTVTASQGFYSYCEAVLGDVSNCDNLIDAVHNIPQDATVTFDNVVINVGDNIEEIIAKYGEELYDILEQFGVTVTEEITPDNIGQLIQDAFEGTEIIPDNESILDIIQDMINSGGDVPVAP